MDSSSSSVSHPDTPCRSPESSTSDVESDAPTFVPQTLELPTLTEVRAAATNKTAPLHVRNICCVGAGYVGTSVPLYIL